MGLALGSIQIARARRAAPIITAAVRKALSNLFATETGKDGCTTLLTIY
jgi:hypothetical protein